MKKNYLLGLACFLSLCLQAQTTFQKTFSFQSFPGLTGLVVTQSHGYAMVGYLDYQSWFIRIDPIGQVVANKKIETGDTYSVRAMEACIDGGFILTATGRVGPAQYNLNLTKLDSMGNIEWSNDFGGVFSENAFKVQQLNDGGFIACGTTNPQETKTLLIRTDASGNLLWTKTYSDTLAIFSRSTPSDIIQTTDLGFLISGYISGTGLQIDPFLIKTNASGDILWSRIYEKTDWNSFEQIKISSDGNYMLAGWMDIKPDSIDDRNISLSKVDLAGNVLWTKVYERPGLNLGLHLETSADNGFVLCGLTDANSTLSNCVLLKVDSSGTLLWTKGFPVYTSFAEGNFVKRTNDNGYIVGSLNGSSTPYKVFLVKTDQAGESNCSHTIPVFTESNTNLNSSALGFNVGSNDSLGNLSLNSTTLNYSAGTICFTDDINEISGGSLVPVYPNPADKMIYVEIPENDDIQIIDPLGKIIYEKRNLKVRKIEIDISKYTSGVYFVLSQKTGMAKFIKN